MLKKISFSAILIFTVITLCLAAALDGDWTGTMTTPDGEQFPVAYHFKSDGDKLTGSVDIPDNKLTIEEGKINGKKFTFKVNFNNNNYLHEGEIMEEAIKVKVHFGETIVENTLKKQSK